jgi:hypothetical protein
MAQLNKTAMFIRNIAGKNQINFKSKTEWTIENILKDFGVYKEWNKDAEIWEWKKDELIKILDDAPKYQRLDKATRIWRQAIISSILNDIPFPSLYFRCITGNQNGKRYKYEIVDGGHRIRTMMKFILGKFKMPGNYGNVVINGEPHPISGLGFTQLPEPVQEKILRTNFTVHQFDSNEWIAARMFQIINDGNDMSRQEYRASIETSLANMIRDLASSVAYDRGEVDDKQALVFNEQHDKSLLVGFKPKNLDWDSALAQCALFSTNHDVNSIDNDALDKFYLDEDYHKETESFLALEDILKDNLNTVCCILVQQSEYKLSKPSPWKPKKSYFVNLYMFIAEVKKRGYSIDDYTTFADQYVIDENKRAIREVIKTEKSNISVGSWGTYSHVTSFKAGKDIPDRLAILMDDFDPKTYGVTKES